jgi:hypothetical protein
MNNYHYCVKCGANLGERSTNCPIEASFACEDCANGIKPSWQELSDINQTRPWTFDEFIDALDYSMLLSNFVIQAVRKGPVRGYMAYRVGRKMARLL